MAPPSLPPAFQLVRLDREVAAFERAVRAAPRGIEHGTVYWSDRGDLLDLALVLEPDVPAAAALQDVHLLTVAACEALAQLLPPTVPVRCAWPADLILDGARVGGVRALRAPTADLAARPPWLVLGLVIQLDAPGAGAAALPDRTSLVAQGAGGVSAGALLAAAYVSKEPTILLGGPIGLDLLLQKRGKAERNAAVYGGHGHAHEQREITRGAIFARGFLDDLLQLVLGVEREAPDAVLVIGATDRFARLHGMHEMQLGAGNGGRILDLGQRRHVEMADAGAVQGTDQKDRAIRFVSISHVSVEIFDEPARRAGGGMGTGTENGTLRLTCGDKISR